MTALRTLAVALLPGGLLLLGAHWLFRCRHERELWRRRSLEGLPATAPRGEMGLECARCGRWRELDLAPRGGDGMGHHLTAPDERQLAAESKRMWRELEGVRR